MDSVFNNRIMVNQRSDIDDAAIGCPLKFEDGRPQPFVDWVKMRELLIRDGILYE